MTIVSVSILPIPPGLSFTRKRSRWYLVGSKLGQRKRVYNRTEERRRKGKKERGLVQYAREYILYSHARMRVNIFCIILKRNLRTSRDDRVWDHDLIEITAQKKQNKSQLRVVVTFKVNNGCCLTSVSPLILKRKRRKKRNEYPSNEALYKPRFVSSNSSLVALFFLLFWTYCNHARTNRMPQLEKPADLRIRNKN